MHTKSLSWKIDKGEGERREKGRRPEGEGRGKREERGREGGR
jgi:hypothetical protein